MIADARERQSTLEHTDVPLVDSDAYAVQDVLTGLRLARGEAVVGWKLGYTTAAMREAMGVDEPNHGPLTDRIVLESPADTSTPLIAPRVEPEIAVRLGSDGRIVSRHLALEVVDSVWSGYRFTWAHNTADGSSAALAVVYDGQLPADVSGAEVQLRTSDGTAESGVVGTDSDPDGAVAWLLSELDRRAMVVPPGAIVLTGGLLPPVPLPADGWAEASLLSATARITWRMQP